jgi:hypothetical protein
MSNQESTKSNPSLTVIWGLTYGIFLTIIYFLSQQFSQQFDILMSALIKLILLFSISRTTLNSTIKTNYINYSNKLYSAFKVASLGTVFSLILVTIYSGFFTKYANDFIGRIHIEGLRITAYFLLTILALIIGVFIFPIVDNLTTRITSNRIKS